MRSYLAKVNRTPQYSNEKHKELLWSYRNNNNEKDLEELVLSFGRLIYKSASKIHIRYENVPKKDLIQEGNEALLKAISIFKDFNNNTNFMSYASKYIKGKMWLYVRRFPIVDKKIESTSKSYRGALFYKTASIYNIINTYDPEMKRKLRKEFSNKIKIPVDVILRVEERCSGGMCEFNEDLHSVRRKSVCDIIDEKLLESVVREKINKLKEEHRVIINNSFFSEQPMTVARLSKTLGVHRRTIDQRKMYALKELKRKFEKSQVFQELNCL